jgi:hypothetical protein
MKEDSKELALKYKTKKIIDLACPVQICAARFSPCGNVLAAACFDGSVPVSYTHLRAHET